MSSNFDTLALANRFMVVLDTIDLGYWASVSGLDVQWELCPYRAGDAGNQKIYFPGATKYSDIQLTRAACADSQKVQTWLSQRSCQKSVTKSSGTIYLGASDNTNLMQWQLVNVMPLKWSIDKFDASASKVAIETLTLAHEGFLADLSTYSLTGGPSAGGAYQSGGGLAAPAADSTG
jgi:phage tail-like protein